MVMPMQTLQTYLLLVSTDLAKKKQLFDTKVNNFKKAYSVQVVKDDEEDTSEDESPRVKKEEEE